MVIGRLRPRTLGSGPPYRGCMVVDFVGLGGQRLSAAPLVYEALQSVFPADALARSLSVWEPATRKSVVPIAPRMHASASARARGPLLIIGMIDAEGKAGRIGGGVADVQASRISADNL